MNINNTKYRLPQGKFFAEADPKDLIVLHTTEGSTVEGAFQSWLSQSIQIGTPYILDADGTVYEIFDPKFWAYNLGVTGAAAQNHKHDRRSVAIEIVSMGPLKLVGETLYSWPNNYGTFYCEAIDTTKYVKAPFRGFDYYAAFTQAQITALVELVKNIAATFNIPMNIPPPDKQDVFDMSFYGTWTGIAAHHNYRADKCDTGSILDLSLFQK